ncbi:MAG: type II toxin-antitoxin system Phd/YefM family antitoxin [Bradyrhizobium sp.]
MTLLPGHLPASKPRPLISLAAPFADKNLYGAVRLPPRRAWWTLSLKGAEEARNQLPEFLDAAEKGRSTIITRHGRPVAAPVPIEARGAAMRQQPLIQVAGSGRGLLGKKQSPHGWRAAGRMEPLDFGGLRRLRSFSSIPRRSSASWRVTRIRTPLQAALRSPWSQAPALCRNDDHYRGTFERPAAAGDNALARRYRAISNRGNRSRSTSTFDVDIAESAARLRPCSHLKLADAV